jgi:alpha-mannosidase
VLPDLQYAAIRFESFVSEVLLPAAFPARVPLQASVWQTPDRVAPGHAATQSFRPVELGWRWGPAWSTAWFRLRGEVGAALAGRRVALRFSPGTEALLWRDGVPYHGFDPYRDLAFLWDRAPAGETVDLLVEAACNLPLGVSTFWWESAEHHARWREANPGRLESAELVAVDEAVWRFAQGFDTARKLLAALPGHESRAHELDRGLRALMARLPVGGAPGAMHAACTSLFPELAALLMGRGPSTPVTCNAVGHAHIDTAWLWPIAETRRKCLRTFANVLRLQERHPHFHFLCSQAQQYAWVEESSPELFAEIAARVEEGRWEAAGAMWIEPDCTCPSGESFVRQILHGCAYWRSRFGTAAPQRFLYLPDTFGFPACLPQVMAQAGIDTFITNKMSWCETNRFPNVTFLWRGLDGTEVLSHLTPGHNYNSAIEPREFMHGVQVLVDLDGARVPAYLQPYGFGDGGGGPTPEQVERANIGARCEGLPRVEQKPVRDFCEDLHEARRALRRAGQDLRVWDGELYLELHRGTYTSQAWIKEANRRCEGLLRLAEMLACMRAGAEADAAVAAEARAALDAPWKTLLLNQFHDILPGSSIREVYDDARVQLDDVRREAVRAVGRGMQWLAGAVAAGGDEGDSTGDRIVVFNPASTAQTGTVAAEGGAVHCVEVPALGVAVVDAAARPSIAPGSEVRVTGARSMRNGFLEVELDEAGRIAVMRRIADGAVANALDEHGAPLPMNQLVTYVDRPRRWEAWDIDRDYQEQATRLMGPADRIEFTVRGPAEAELVVERAVGRASRIVQRHRLVAGSPRLDIVTDVEWNEEQVLLRALFPCAVRARRATFGTQFGHVERAAHDNTSWERAQFEVPGHGWMDLSQPGLGVAVLDDGKFGRSARHGTLGLSLLKAPNFPDPTADRGRHRFTYSLMVHGGDWRAAGVDAQAEQLNHPLVGIELRGAAPAGAARVAPGWQGVDVHCDGAGHLEVSALKPGESTGTVALRVVEVRGGGGTAEVRWGFPVRDVQAADLFEEPRDVAAIEHDAAAGVTRFAVRPFGIVTLRATLAGAGA